MSSYPGDEQLAWEMAAKTDAALRDKGVYPPVIDTSLKHERINSLEVAAALGAEGVLSPAPPQDQQTCIIGRYCGRHGFVHGAEAEELREHIEKYINEQPSARIRDIQAVLDAVDARDSLAYCESRSLLSPSPQTQEPANKP